jgi:hypothetical protein
MKRAVVSFAAAILMASFADAQVPTGKAFDGVWASAANITLIKEMRTYLIMQGKDAESTWSAHCVKKGASATCRGSGVRNEGEQFVYESTMTAKDGGIEEAWRATFAGAQVVEGKDALKPVPIPPQR